MLGEGQTPRLCLALCPTLPLGAKLSHLLSTQEILYHILFSEFCLPIEFLFTLLDGFTLISLTRRLGLPCFSGTELILNLMSNMIFVYGIFNLALEPIYSLYLYHRAALRLVKAGVFQLYSLIKDHVCSYFLFSSRQI